MLSFFVYLECLPRPFTLSLEGLTSLQSVSPVFLPTDHCPPTCPDPVGVTAHYCFKSFTCNTHGSLRKCCKQKTYAQLSPLNATFTKNRGGWGCYGLSGRTSIPVRCPDLSPLFPTLTKTAGCCTQNSHSGRGCTPNVQTFNLQTFKRSSRHPLVPLQPNALGATIGNDTRILHDPGKQLCSPRCLRLRERISRTVQDRSRSQTPIRSGLQVVPRPNVLKLDRSAGWLALQQRAGKAGSVRLG